MVQCPHEIPRKSLPPQHRPPGYPSHEQWNEYDRGVQVDGPEFPELAVHLQVQLPDERSRRVGQSIDTPSLQEVYKVMQQEV